MESFDFAALGEMGHLMGEFGEASNSKFSKSTQGNSVALVHDKKNLPSIDKMEPNVLYLHKNDQGELCASGIKKSLFSSSPSTVNLEKELSPEVLKRVKSSLDNVANPKSPSGEDLKEVFSKSTSVISKTYRQTALDGAEKAATAVASVFNNPVGAALVAGARETAAVVVTGANMVITPIAGAEKSIPLLQDTFVRRQTGAAVAKMGQAWDWMKEKSAVITEKQKDGTEKKISPLEYVDKAIEAKNKLVNSKATSHAVSIGFGVTAALALGAGAAFSAPVSIPLMAVSAAGVIGAGVRAEKRREDHATHKTHLEDLVKSIGQKEHSIEQMKQNNHEATAILGLSEDKLRDLPKEKVSVFRATHSYAGREIGKTLFSNAALIAVKSIEAVSNPLSVGLQGAALVVGSASSVATRLNEHDAKQVLKKEIDLLEKMAPQDATKNKYELAKKAKESSIEAEAIKKANDSPEFQKALKAAEGKKMDSIEVTKVRNQFAVLKEDATKKFEANPENQKAYKKEKLEETKKTFMGRISSIGKSIKEYGTHTANYLFNEKSSYKENLGLKSETNKVVEEAYIKRGKSVVLDDVKKGVELKPISREKSSLDPAVLGDIKNGVNLKPISKDNKNIPVEANKIEEKLKEKSSIGPAVLGDIKNGVNLKPVSKENTNTPVDVNKMEATLKEKASLSVTCSSDVRSASNRLATQDKGKTRH